MHLKEGLTLEQALQIPNGIRIIAIPLKWTNEEETPFTQLEESLEKVTNFSRFSLKHEM